MNPFKFLKNMCGCCGCDSSPKKEKDQYKCASCGNTSDKAEECCGKNMEKLCSCSSGKYAKDCCEA